MSAASAAPSMSRDMIQRLMARAQETAPAPADPPKTEAFDWTRPHRFHSEARSILEGLGRRIALAMQKTLNDQFSQTIEAGLKETREHCAYLLMQETARGADGPFVVGLRNESKQVVGCLLISFESACFLVAQMLNDPEAAVGSEGRFSALEESILMDVALMLSGPLEDVLQEQLKLTIQPADQLVRGDWVMAARILEDLCEFSFGLRFGEKEAVFSLLLESEVLDLYAGIKSPTGTSASLSSVRILERLRRAPISVHATLTTDLIRLEDLARLEPGDVLVLGKKISTPLQVLLNGRRCFHAFPAEQKGKIALVITDSVNEYE